VSNAEKQPPGRGLKGCDENRPAAYFDRNESHIISGTGHYRLETLAFLHRKP